MLRLALTLALVAASASAEDFKSNVETYDPLNPDGEDGEARTVFTSNGNYFIALNTTYLLLYAALLGAGLLGALALASLFSGPEETGYGYGGGHSGGGYGQQQSSGYGAGGGGGGHGYRQRRAAFEAGKNRRLQFRKAIRGLVTEKMKPA